MKSNSRIAADYSAIVVFCYFLAVISLYFPTFRVLRLMYPQNLTQLSWTDGQMASLIRWKRQLSFQNVKRLCLTEDRVGDMVTVAALDKGLVGERENLEMVGCSVTHKEDPEVDLVAINTGVLIDIR